MAERALLLEFVKRPDGKIDAGCRYCKKILAPGSGPHRCDEMRRQADLGFPGVAELFEEMSRG